MPSLSELQHLFCDAVIGDAPVSLPIHGHGLPAGQRLQVYRNMAGSLFLEALQTSYPAVQGLVGEEFFEQAAHAYQHIHPSQVGNLQTYGACFPAFLETMPGTSELAYLGDVARLEWARQEVYLAADRPYLDHTTFAAAIEAMHGDVRLVLHPALRFIRSPHAVFDIWRYCREPSADRLELAGRGQNVLLWRDEGKVAMQVMDDAVAAFLAALAEGKALSVAIEEAVRLQNDLDAGAWIAWLLHRRLITGIDPVNE